MLKKSFIFLLVFAIFLFEPIYLLADDDVYNPADLKDYFGTMKNCTNDGTENDCRNGNEYKFYLKMYDIYYLYKNKYNVTIDTSLLMSALFYNHEEPPTVFKRNLNAYSRREVKSGNTVTNLDWEYDFKNDQCYTYLNANEFTFDMQILAKNQVTKTTNYNCMAEDEETGEMVVVSREKVDDIEDSNYSTETLVCEEGEYDPDSTSSSYKLDLDKYDKFLLEYVKLKYHTPGVPIKDCAVANEFTSDLASNNSSSNSNSTYTGENGRNIVLSPTGQATIDQLNQIAVNQIGNTGDTYQSWFGMYDEWCAMFVSWLFDQVGGIGKYIASAEGTAGGIPESSDAAGLGTWLEDECTNPEVVPRAGDIIVFDPWVGGVTVPYPEHGENKYYSSHVGYVYKVDDQNVYSIEGNGELGGYNGVWEHVRERKYCGSGTSQGINGYFRPNY